MPKNSSLLRDVASKGTIGRAARMLPTASPWDDELRFPSLSIRDQGRAVPELVVATEAVKVEERDIRFLQ
jgi:hypothetical protein